MIYKQIKIVESDLSVEFNYVEYNQENKSKELFFAILPYIPFQTLLNLVLGFLMQ
ncbi:hypothetical protein DSECCO2_579360 [anaerobic digester metagenome]